MTISRSTVSADLDSFIIRGPSHDFQPIIFYERRWMA